ncbi:MAG: hypothetical protein M3O46_14990 [Myxococcota bacterium]|nr:hypothetical protein [Myxococcota bacterium]
MHRDPSFSFAETIARLEAEVCELRSLGGRRRERRLVVTAIVCMLVAIHMLLTCVAIKVQADRHVRETSKRLEGRTNDFILCARRVEALSSRADMKHLDRCPCGASPDSTEQPKPQEERGAPAQ